MKNEIQYGAQKLLGPVPIGAYEIFEGELPRAIQRSHKLLNLAVQVHDTDGITVPIWVLELLQSRKFDLPRIFPAQENKIFRNPYSREGRSSVKGVFGILEKGKWGKEEKRKRVILERVKVNE